MGATTNGAPFIQNEQKEVVSSSLIIDQNSASTLHVNGIECILYPAVEVTGVVEYGSVAGWLSESISGARLIIAPSHLYCR